MVAIKPSILFLVRSIVVDAAARALWIEGKLELEGGLINSVMSILVKGLDRVIRCLSNTSPVKNTTANEESIMTPDVRILRKNNIIIPAITQIIPEVVT